MDYLFDFDKNPYEFEPQTPEPFEYYFKHPVRFLADDGGIRTGIIMMAIPAGYDNKRPKMWYYRVLDLRRMQLYTIAGDALQMMRART